MRRSLLHSLICTAVSLTMLTAGCGEAEDPAVTSLRERFVLKSSPGESTAFSGVRTRLKENQESKENQENEEDSETVKVVLRGRIHAGDLPPWETGKAAFVLTDITGHEGETDHDPHECPFCSRNINDYLAKVRFFKDGELVTTDSRSLFLVHEKQIVEIVGTGRLDAEGMLAVAADGIYIPDRWGNIVFVLVGIGFAVLAAIVAIQRKLRMQRQVSSELTNA